MSRRKRHPAQHESSTGTAQWESLRRTDRGVLIHLSQLQKASGGENCTAGLPGISAGAGVSQRQAQISVNRLIKAGFLRRVGYDLGNPVRARRGTVYKVLILADVPADVPFAEVREAIKFLLATQVRASARMERIEAAQENATEQIADLVAGHRQLQSILEEVIKVSGTQNTCSAGR
jgi:hypothetical protein